jgi:hypothetical protein
MKEKRTIAVRSEYRFSVFGSASIKEADAAEVLCRHSRRLAI